MARRESIDVGYPGTHVRYLSVYNDSGESAPAGAAMRITRIDGQGIAHVTKPDSNGQTAGIVFNALVSLPAASYGSATQEMPAVAAYTVADAEDDRSLPINGEVWGTVADSWHLSRGGCGNGYYILGGAGDGLVNVTLAENKPRKFRITARTESVCGNSGSGTGDTDHTIYTYTLHSVRAVDDGDGCQSFVNEDVDIAIVVDEAYEQNGHKVSIGAVVDANRVTFTDESIQNSGSGTSQGPSGCRWTFSHEEPTPITISFSYRYFCVSGILKEYLVGSDGASSYVRDVGCCECTDSGDQPSCDLCSPAEDSLCVTLSGFSSTLSDVGGHDCLPPSTISMAYVGAIDDFTQKWMGTENDSDGEEWTAIMLVTCGVSSYLTVYSDTAVCDFRPLGALNPSPDACTFPQTFTLYNTFGANCAGGNYVNCSLTAIVSSGLCDDVGSGSGADCPCVWQCQSSSWTLISGGAPCSLNPPGGSFVCTGQNGQLAYTNEDGSDCEPGGGDGGNDCSDCSFSAGDVATTVTSGAAGFLSGVSNPSMTYVASATPHFSDGTGQASGCGQTAYMFMWCEGGKWMITIRDSGQAFLATSGDCTTATFDLEFTTDNTLCPGQTASLHVVVTLP